MINQAALAQGAGGPERRNTMRKRIAVMKGDGIGPEIVTEAKKVLDRVGQVFGHTFHYTEVDMGGVSIDKYGVPLTKEALETAKNSDSVLLGAVGGHVGNSRWYDVAPGGRLPVKAGDHRRRL